MKQNTQYFIIGVLMVILLFGFIRNSNSSYETILVDEAKNLIANENVFIINTHTPYVGEIEGTDIIAENWDNMASYINDLPSDKSTPILVYCRSARMSQTSAEQLIELGYKNVYNLEGGMNAWQNSGNELIVN